MDTASFNENTLVNHLIQGLHAVYANLASTFSIAVIKNIRN